MSLETKIERLTDALIAATASVNVLIKVMSTAEPPKELGDAGVEHFIGEDDIDANKPISNPMPDMDEGLQGQMPESKTIPITREDLSAYLAEQANKFGKPAQDAIKNIILETGGTQALSQVVVDVYPIIKQKVEAWVATQNG